MPVKIDRCICEDKPFSELVTRALRDDLDVRALAEVEGCGTHCGWCVAYLRRAIASGETVFSDVLPKEGL